ncbi:YtxH domain-containing protein [Flavobacterium sp. K5-23]|uniref:YtxH domain-containing protein n=1 Tax=Flavobacterium sp. K5-23 TaxID=2746225 RepID=UPI00200EA1D3|nr:YtxH domain-containing protein [Flavobacterium sp. K5-23]UQD55584.1 YtxH domain-containing protein [Flavobacterium sp. K5-23]
MSSNTGNTLLALLTGAAIGAGVGILFAPDKGSKTRVKIKDGYKVAKKDLKFKIDDVSSDLKSKMKIAKLDLEETYDDMLCNMSVKTEEVITFLEAKLADLKTQNAKLQK